MKVKRQWYSGQQFTNYFTKLQRQQAKQGRRFHCAPLDSLVRPAHRSIDFSHDPFRMKSHFVISRYYCRSYSSLSPRATSQRGGAGTFSVDVAVASRQPPVKVECAYRLYVAVAGAVEQHSLLNVQRALHFSQLGFLPKEREEVTSFRDQLGPLCIVATRHIRRNCIPAEEFP